MLPGFLVGATIALVTLGYIIYKDLKRLPWGTVIEEDADTN